MILAAASSIWWLMSDKQQAGDQSRSATAASLSIPTMIFGDMRGYFEPCGCSPETDLGGLNRLGGSIDLQRTRWPNLEVYSTGNHFHGTEFRLQESFIQKGLELLKPTAMLLGLSEWKHIHKLSSEQRSGYLLSHHNPAQTYGLKKHVLSAHSLIFGLHHTEQLSPQRKDFRYMRKQQLRWPQKRSVLLLATENSAGFFDEFSHQLWLFDLIVLTHPQPISHTQIVPARLRPELAVLLYRELGKTVMSTSLGGSALTSLGLPSLTAPSSSFSSFSSSSFSSDGSLPALQKLMEAADSNSSATSTQDTRNPTKPRLLWLTKDVPKTQIMESVVTKYRLAQKQQFKESIASKLTHLGSSLFMGSESCAGCHPSAYKVWKSSAHGSAFATLSAKNQHENQTCIVCHVVALQTQGGFISESYTPHLKNVGCESCHGPRAHHLQAVHDGTTFTQTSNPWNCSGCHHPPHVTGFDQQSAWLKIQHGY